MFSYHFTSAPTIAAVPAVQITLTVSIPQHRTVHLLRESPGTSLGVRLGNDDPEKGGTGRVIVLRTASGGPAAAAGMNYGDSILAVNDVRSTLMLPVCMLVPRESM